MNSKKLVALLIVLTFLAVTPEMARAGAGGPGAAVSVPLFDCYVIQDAVDPGFTLELNDQFGTQTGPVTGHGDPAGVRLGKPKMVCTQSNTATTHVVEGGKFDREFMTRFFTNREPTRHVKCYEVSSVSGPVDVPKKVVDIFGTDTVDVMQLGMVCAPAYKDDPEP